MKEKLLPRSYIFFGALLALALATVTYALTISARYAPRLETELALTAVAGYAALGAVLLFVQRRYTSRLATAYKDLKQQQALLEKSELRLKEAQRVASIGNWELDLKSGHLYWSDEIFRIFEIDKSKFPASYEAFLDAIHPDDRAKVNDAYRTSLETRRPYDIRHRLLMQDGRIKHVHECCETFYDERKNPIRSAGTVQDITDLVVYEESLLLKDRAIAASITGIVMASPDGLITYVNPAFLGLWRCASEAEALGRPLAELFASPKATDEMLMALRQGSSWVGERVARRQDKTAFDVQLSASVVTNENNSPMSLMVSFVDVTERNKVSEELEKSLYEKEILLREIHHRVKNNLQIVASLLYFQSKKIRGREDAMIFEDCRNRLKSMILVHEKLYMSNDVAHVDFADYLQVLSEDVVKPFNKDGLKVTVSMNVGHIRLPVEIALPCGMIVNETLTNIGKYAFPDGRYGTAKIDAYIVGDDLHMTVADDGVGLPLDSALDDPKGFGFLLVRNLTSQMNGSLSIDNSRGAALRFTIPLTHD